MRPHGPGRTIRQRLTAVAAVISLLVAGCGRGTHPAAAPSAQSPTIASLVPSATDLIIGMGAGDHLIAVSNYDHASSLPRVGDYETIDWEKLARLRPNVLITFYGSGKAPSGLLERTHALGIRVVNLNFDRLDDVYAAIGVLGEVCAEPAKAAAELKRIQDALRATHDRVANEPRVRAVISTEPSGLDFAGRANYLDDLLNEAGGENALTTPGYVTLDREAIAAMKPQVILQLLPAADDPTREKNRAFWESFRGLPAVKEHRVWQYTEPYMMTPGHVAEVAATFAEALHPSKGPPSAPSTRNGSP